MEPSFASWPDQDDSSPSKSMDKSSKKPRHRHSAVQLAALNELFDRDDHPALDDRVVLADRLGMETKTVNAWFQNKRASTKKRTRAATVAPPSLGLPPIASLLATSSSSSTASSRADELDDDPDFESHRSTGRMIHITQADHPPPPQQQTAFYAGNPEHRHVYDSTPAAEPASRPKMRARPSSYQTEELRRAYARNSHPTKEDREELCSRIGMRYQSVTNWFQNQRSLAKRRQEDEDANNAAARRPSSSSLSRPSRRYPPHPPASEHPSLPPSLSSILNRDERSSSVEPSVGSASSRASPYPIMPVHRPRRTRPEPYQLAALKRLYRRTATPSIEERGALALEVGMDLAKVTNWFRNLRQTTRKRARKLSDDDSDSMQLNSAPPSRGATPSLSSSWGGTEHERDPDMETEVDSAEHDAMDVDTYEPADQEDSVHSDAGTDDDESHEPVTPPSSSASPPPPGLAHVEPLPMPASHKTDLGLGMNVDPDTYARLEKIPGRLSGVKVEDALLLLSFHQHIVH